MQGENNNNNKNKNNDRGQSTSYVFTFLFQICKAGELVREVLVISSGVMLYHSSIQQTI